MKLIYAAGLSLLLAAFAAGCTNGNGQRETGYSERDKEDIEMNGSSEEKINDIDEYEGSMLRIFLSSDKINNLQILNNTSSPELQFLEEHTNSKLQVQLYPRSGFKEMLHAVVTADDAPDVILMDDPASFSKYVKEEYLLPLNDLIEQYGRELLELYPAEVWEGVTFNGKIYAVPSLAEVPANEILYARKDWLDTLGLPPPKTLEEYYQAMHAFTYGDPDQNGKNDTWGLTFLPDRLARTAPFFGAFGVKRSHNQIYQWEEREGQLIYSSLLPETKDAITFLARLYGTGVLDREFVLNKYGSFKEKIVNGKIGIFSANWDEAQGIIGESSKKNPLAEWIRLDYPIGKDGQTGTAQSDGIQAYSVIPARSQNAEEAIELLKFIAGEGHTQLKLGLTDYAQSISQRLIYTLANSNAPDVRRKLLDKRDPSGQLNRNADIVLKHSLKSDYYGPPTSSMGKYTAKLMKLEEEAFVKIIMGIDPSRDFDDFEKQWVREGGWEITNEVNEWFRDKERKGG